MCNFIKNIHTFKCRKKNISILNSIVNVPIILGSLLCGIVVWPLFVLAIILWVDCFLYNWKCKYTDDIPDIGKTNLLISILAFPILLGISYLIEYFVYDYSLSLYIFYVMLLDWATILLLPIVCVFLRRFKSKHLIACLLFTYSVVITNLMYVAISAFYIK